MCLRLCRRQGPALSDRGNDLLRQQASNRRRQWASLTRSFSDGRWQRRQRPASAVGLPHKELPQPEEYSTTLQLREVGTHRNYSANQTERTFRGG